MPETNHPTEHHHHGNHTTHHATWSPWERHERHAARNAPLEVQDTDWVWVPIVVLAVFALALLMTKKCKRFKGQSARFVLTHYFSVEPLLNSLRGIKVSSHEYLEQKKAEIGHQFLVFVAFIYLTLNFAFFSDLYRWMFFIPSAVQIALWFLNFAVDWYLISFYGTHGLRACRSLNSKLRFAHGTYQVALFCADYLQVGVVQLPVDCYIWATTHYIYEAIGLLLEGLNLIGLSELAVIVLVNASAMSNSNVNSNGPLAAFGITCILLSCASLVIGIPYKIFDAKRQLARGRESDDGDSSGGSTGEGEGEDGHRRGPHHGEGNDSTSQGDASTQPSNSSNLLLHQAVSSSAGRGGVSRRAINSTTGGAVVDIHALPPPSTTSLNHEMDEPLVPTTN